MLISLCQFASSTLNHFTSKNSQRENQKQETFIKGLEFLAVSCKKKNGLTIKLDTYLKSPKTQCHVSIIGNRSCQ